MLANRVVGLPNRARQEVTIDAHVDPNPSRKRRRGTPNRPEIDSRTSRDAPWRPRASGGRLGSVPGASRGIPGMSQSRPGDPQGRPWAPEMVAMRVARASTGRQTHTAAQTHSLLMSHMTHVPHARAFPLLLLSIITLMGAHALEIPVRGHTGKRRSSPQRLLNSGSPGEPSLARPSGY